MSRWVEIPKTNHQGGLIIEVPEEHWAEQFLKTALSLLPKVKEDVHPVLRRANIVIQFPERMILSGDQGNTFQGNPQKVYGDGVIVHKSRKSGIVSVPRVDISVSLEAVRRSEKAFPQTSGHINALGLVLHELEEANYFIQSAEPYEQGKVGDPAYSSNDHEKIPTARALKWLKTENGCDYILNKGYYVLP